MNPRRQRETLRSVINQLRAGTHALVDAHLPGSVDECTRLIQTLERHYKELPARSSKENAA